MGEHMGQDNWVSTMGLFLVAVLVPVAAYYATRFLVGKTQTGNKKAGMKLLDRLYLSRDKYILVVKIAGKGYVLGVTNQSVSPIDTLSQEQLSQYEQAPPASGGGSGTFSDRLKRLMQAPEALRSAREQQRKGRGDSHNGFFAQNPRDTTGFPPEERDEDDR
jgi:flagellar biosynthetic protein FliO